MADIAVFVDGTQVENGIHFTPVKEIMKQSRSRTSGRTLFKDFISQGARGKPINTSPYPFINFTVFFSKILLFNPA
jgi:hypothetical protein